MIFKSPHGIIPIPEDQTAWNWLEKRADETPDKPAYICAITERTLTWADVYDQARKICAGLASQGVKKGDIVTLHSFNCVEYPVIFMALMRLGAVCSSASPMFNEEELSDQLKHSDTVAIISHAKLVATATKAASLSGIDSKRVYTIGRTEGSASLTSIEDLAAKDIPFPNLPPINPDDVVAMPFSSGTTARPKGVQLTGRALFSGALMSSYSEKDMEYTVGVLPFFHVLATLLFHTAMFRGWGTIVLPRFDPDDYLRAICKYKVWNLHCAPPIVQFMAKHPAVDNYDLSHVKFMGAGGAPLGIEVEEAVLKRIGVKVGQGYGMTEFCGPVTMPAYEINRPGSTGQLLPNSEALVQDLSTPGAYLGPRQTGELLIRTPAMMKGYYKSPEENDKVFTEDGFCHTGDVGYIDEDGFVFIVDRLKEMIKYKGHQVAPAELEDVLHGHPALADSCCVRGKDLESGEEVPKAFVVVKDGVSVTAEDVMKFVTEKVAPYKQIRQVEFIDSIPKTLSGKILRRQLQVQEDKKVKAMTAP
ncbi:hypothetical protein PHYBOEH_001758 [Phytophthora boehmeriae]|uniref:4-coumarate-CoA ligase n=1 Tax=Phytophthora boehmeriae TaxID=109152 RepID=A0A8T1X576_9STRA|nr:hypothetical protein PHYBOEH_001758 [Phytophthora boehmeriae]